MTESLIEIITILIRKIEEIEHYAIEDSELAKLSRKQIYYLDKINHLNNPTLGELAKHLNLSKPSITAIVERFAKEDYLIKVKSDEDRRSSHVHLTKKGEAISKLHDKIHSKIASVLTSGLDEKETHQLVHLLSKAIGSKERL